MNPKYQVYLGLGLLVAALCAVLCFFLFKPDYEAEVRTQIDDLVLLLQKNEAESVLALAGNINAVGKFLADSVVLSDTASRAERVLTADEARKQYGALRRQMRSFTTERGVVTLALHSAEHPLRATASLVLAVRGKTQSGREINEHISGSWEWVRVHNAWKITRGVIDDVQRP